MRTSSPAQQSSFGIVLHAFPLGLVCLFFPIPEPYTRYPRLQDMPHLFFFGPQIPQVHLMGLISMGSLTTVMPYPSDPTTFLGLFVRPCDLFHARSTRNWARCRSPAVLLESQFDVCLHRVASVLLEFIGLDLASPGRSPVLLVHVDDDALGLVDYDLHGPLELVSAVAAHGPEDVAPSCTRSANPAAPRRFGRDLSFTKARASSRPRRSRRP